MLVDIHCHLTASEFSKDIEGVIKRAGDMLVISSGLNLEDNKKVLELCRKFKNVRAGLGLYPVDGLGMDEAELQRNLKFIEKNKDACLYMGEVGLDYKDKGYQRLPYQPPATTMKDYQRTFFDKKASPKNEPPATTNGDKEKQKEVFLKCIQLAEKIKKPLLIHSRKAEEDCVGLLESSDVKKVIFHCFTGDFKIARKIMDKGWSFSIPSSLVRDGRFQRIVEEVDISQLFTESDAPFLSPFSGRNEPSFVVEGVKKIAELKLLEEEEVENILYMNFQKMFRA